MTRLLKSEQVGLMLLSHNFLGYRNDKSGVIQDCKFSQHLEGLWLEGGRSELLYMCPLKNFPVCNGPCGGIVNWKLTAQIGGGQSEKHCSRGRVEWERSNTISMELA